MFYIERQQNIDAIKQQYIAAIKKKSDFLDKGFLNYATNPDNIIVSKKKGCKISLTYEISLHMSFREKHYYTRTKGYNVEAKSDKLYVTKDTELNSFWSDGFKSFDRHVGRSFLGEAGRLISTDNQAIDIRNCTEINDKDLDYFDKLDDLFKQAGFGNEDKFFEKLESATLQKELYSKEINDARRSIEQENSEVRSIECTEVKVIGFFNHYMDGYDVVFKDIYTIGVRYNGKDYFTTYFDNFSEIPIEYSKEALHEAENKANATRAMVKKKRCIATAVYSVALILLLAMLALTILSTYVFPDGGKYSVGWIKFFTHFPESLIAIIPIALITIAFGMTISESSYSLYGISDTPSHKSVSDMIRTADSDFKKKRVFLYVTVVIAILYVIVQSVTFIWGPGFPVTPTPEESTGHAYTIDSIDDLTALPEKYGGTVELAGDLNLNGATIEGIKSFEGEFDGNGYTISNFKVISDTRNCGLFQTLNGTVKDLILNDFIVGSQEATGGLAGTNYGIIENCAVIDGTVEGTLSVGAIAGANNGTITKCYAEDVSVTVSAGGSVGYGGGIAGNNGGSITNSHATTAITVRTNAGSELYAGGLAGWNAYTLSSSYSIITIQVNSFSGRVHIGGLCGNTTFAVQNCFYESESVESFGDSTKDGAYNNCYSVAELTEEYSSPTEMFVNTLGSESWLAATLKWDVGVWHANQSGYPELVWAMEE